MAHIDTAGGDRVTPRTFEDAAADLDGVFGTENVGPFLYALAKLCRPRSVLEVGAGFSTLYLLKALQENVRADGRERATNTYLYGKTDHYAAGYRPFLLTLDDVSHGNSQAPKVSRVAAELGLDDALILENADFKGFSGRIPARLLPLDLVWFDCGGLQEYVDFTNEYWPLVNPAGGLIVFHSTQTNLALRLFIMQIAERQRASSHAEFELLSLLEPHKRLQNSLSVVRLKRRARTPLYTYVP